MLGSGRHRLDWRHSSGEKLWTSVLPVQGESLPRREELALEGGRDGEGLATGLGACEQYQRPCGQRGGCSPGLGEDVAASREAGVLAKPVQFCCPLLGPCC